MEGWAVKRRGSALAVLLIVVSVLGGLLALEYARWRRLQRDVGDSILQAKLDTAARDALELVTGWLFQRKPENPRGEYGVMTVSPKAGPEQLEIPLPAEIGRFSTTDAEVEIRVQWCLFAVSPYLNANSRVAEYPPSLNGLATGASPRIFRQSYAQLQPGRTGQTLSRKGAWRVAVAARPRSPLPGALHTVALERVVVVER